MVLVYLYMSFYYISFLFNLPWNLFGSKTMKHFYKCTYTALASWGFFCQIYQSIILTKNKKNNKKIETWHSFLSVLESYRTQSQILAVIKSRAATSECSREMQLYFQPRRQWLSEIVVTSKLDRS